MHTCTHAHTFAHTCAHTQVHEPRAAAADIQVLRQPQSTLFRPTPLRAALLRPTLFRPTLLRPTLFRPTLLRPTVLRPTLLRPTLLRLTLLRPTLFRFSNQRDCDVEWFKAAVASTPRSAHIHACCPCTFAHTHASCVDGRRHGLFHASATNAVIKLRPI